MGGYHRSLAAGTLLLCALAAAPGRPGAAEPAPAADPQVSALLERVRDRHNLPGLIGAVVAGDRLAALGVAGVRKAGSPEPVTATDRVHLGSCTKAMTATRVAMLVEQGKLRWTSTPAGVFPDLRDDIHPGYHQVTLAQLLTHRAGLPANPPKGAALLARFASAPRPEQRVAMLKAALKTPPESEPGTKHAYSNLG